jgi:hypothetical protein
MIQFYIISVSVPGLPSDLHVFLWAESRADLWVDTNVSEENSTSILKAKMEVVCLSESLVGYTYNPTQRYNLGDQNGQLRCDVISLVICAL